jgi:hypothetical protein
MIILIMRLIFITFLFYLTWKGIIANELQFFQSFISKRSDISGKFLYTNFTAWLLRQFFRMHTLSFMQNK